MTLPSLNRSATLSTQVILSGKVEDGLVPGESPRSGLQVKLLVVEPDTEPKDYPLGGKVRPDGCFAFFGVPDRAFPQLADRTYALQIEASAPNFETAIFNFNLGAIANQPQRVRRSLPDALSLPDMEVVLFTDPVATPPGDPAIITRLPMTDIRLTLSRHPVRLQGQILNPDDQGIAGATIVIDGRDSTSTHSDGRFVLPDPLPLALSLTVTVSAPGFTEKLFTYEPDYRQPINSLLIRLIPDS